MPDDLGQQHISMSFTADPLSVRAALEQILDALIAYGFSDEDRGVSELVLAEVMNNIVEHAYKEKNEGDIQVALQILGKSLICHISDQGVPMPDNALPKLHHADLTCEREDLPEGGWGWMMIHELAENLTYKREDESNHVRFKLTPQRAFI